jgi:NAD(P)-dependent dehydrogenase (short-subunit alcohol dehydrogenase family)
VGLLDGKVAIVTGGGGGIGRGVSERFGAEGARVVVAEIEAGRAEETAASITGAGGDALTVVADVRDPEAVDDMVQRTIASFGRVDVLVNNVGHYLHPGREFHTSSPGDWHDLYRTNLEHVLLCTRAVIPHLVEQGTGGSIVSVATVEAIRAMPGMAVYSAFKAGVLAFTRSIALEYGRYGIRANAIAPDVTETIQVPYSQWVKPEDQHLVPIWVPVGHFGEPADVAGTVLFLASDLSSFVTGATVPTDGGTLMAGGWFRTEGGRWTNRPRKP